MLCTVFTGNSFGIQDGSNAAHYVHQALRGDVAFAAFTMVQFPPSDHSPPIHSLGHQHTPSDTHPRQLIHSLGHQYTHSAICLTHIHTGSLAYSLSHARTHSLTHSLIYTYEQFVSKLQLCTQHVSFAVNASVVPMYSLCQCIR